MRLTVVSNPATSRRNAIRTSSSGHNWPGWPEMCTRSESRSSAGVTRLASVSAVRYAITLRSASRTTWGGTADTNALDQARKLLRSAAGTPSRSQITVLASGTAYASIRSTGGPAGAAASSSSATCSIRGRSRETVRAVRAWLTSRRSRVCAGGSEFSMCAASGELYGPASPGGNSSRTPAWSLLSR